MPTIYLYLGLAGVFLALATFGYVEHEKLLAAKADLRACGAANQAFQDKLEELTADKAAADKKAAADLAALRAQTDKSNQDLQRQLQEVDHAAVPDDDRESPALRAALDRMRANRNSAPAPD